MDVQDLTPWLDGLSHTSTLKNPLLLIHKPSITQTALNKLQPLTTFLGVYFFVRGRMISAPFGLLPLSPFNNLIFRRYAWG